jgi:DNA-directed RNA polymerase specialized sigma24 family protein
MENSTQNFDQNYVAAAIRAAGVRASSLKKSFRLSGSEFEDANQEILLGLLEKASKYDPQKSSANTFTGAVSKHLAADIAVKLSHDRRSLAFLPPPVEAANDSQFQPDIDALLEDCGQVWGGDCDLFAESDTLHDLNAAIAFMTSEQGRLLELLVIHQNTAAACKASGISTATFYRRVHEMQMHLRMFGMRAAA